MLLVLEGAMVLILAHVTYFVQTLPDDPLPATVGMLAAQLVLQALFWSVAQAYRRTVRRPTYLPL